MNVAIAQKAYADFSRGEVPAVVELMDDSVEWITPGDDALSGTRNGKSGVAEFFALVAQTWHFDSFEPKQFIPFGDQVIVVGSYTSRSVVTGRVASCDWVMIWTFRDGKITRFQEFTDTAILKAALPESSAAAA
jgi:ketosteroid isomerase-like protein